MDKRNLAGLFVITSIVLFFLQTLRVIFSVMFGIIYDQVFVGLPGAWLVVSNLLVILAFVAPALTPRRLRPSWIAAFSMITAFARIALNLNDASIRLWSSLAVLAAGGVCLAGFIKTRRSTLLPALFIALTLDQMLRLFGNTYDLGLRPEWLPVQVAWSFLVIFTVLRFRESLLPEKTENVGLGALDGLGFGGLLFIEMSLLSLPNAVMRWSGTSYPIACVSLLIMNLILIYFLLDKNQVAHWFQNFSLRIVLAAILPLGLMVGYFIPGLLAFFGLLLAQLAVLVGFVLIFAKGSSPGKSLGGGLALGMFIFLLLNYFNAFAFTYPYALPFMRSLGWVVYLAAALATGWRLLTLPVQEKPIEVLRLPAGWLAGSSLLILILSLYAAWPRPSQPLSEAGKLRIATYNIHYGYDTYWHFRLEDTARTIEAGGADIVALQEVDTGRLTSYGIDDAYYLAKRLQMNVAYLPTVEHLTGIAVLYRGEAEAIDWRWVTSLQEQTGILHIALTSGSESLHAYGIWMGLSDEDTKRQIQEALEFIGTSSPAAFGGDFNVEPNSPVAQAIQRAGFTDPFVTLGLEPPPFTDPAINPDKRIDFIWLRGLQPLNAWVPESLASDHRMVVVEVQTP